MSTEDPIGDKPRHEGPVIYASALFNSEMLKKLRANDHKAHWSTKHLLDRLREEVDELEDAVKYDGPEEIISECADVANFAMMIADNERTKANKE